ncbi:MAG TPA: hypothetical protein VJB36_10475, partial [Methylomirabilota bacterium]|nr:hypothetical protein [Methylomirabilota bacterium]
MTDEPVSPRAEATVDVARLMEEIKERVRQRWASGFYSEEEVRRIAQMELEVAEVVPGLRDESERHLADLNDAWDTLREPVITSHRPGLGPVIVALKRLVLRLTRPYANLILARQVEFNTRVLHLLNGFVLPVRDKFSDLHGSLVGLTRKIEELPLEVHERLAVEHTEGLRRHRELGQRLDRLVGELASLR